MKVSDLFGSIFLILICIVIYKALQARKLESVEVRTVKQLPASVQSIVGVMDVTAQNAFFLEYGKRKKKLFISYLLFGWHYIYLKKIGLQFAYWFTFAGLLLWAILDLFRMPKLVLESNANIAREIIQTLSLRNSFKVPE